MAALTRKPDNIPWLSSYILVSHFDECAALYRDGFGFEMTSEMRGDSGRIEHSEWSHKGQTIFMAAPEDAPSATAKSPATGGFTIPSTFYVYVDDVDAHYEQATAAGATPDQPPQDQFWGDRAYEVKDPAGYSWMFATRLADT